MRSRLLQGFRALDLTTPIAFDCGRILASLGVDVIRIDPPALAAAGNRAPPGPFEKEAALWKSVTWRTGNADKRCITLDITSDTGRRNFLELLKVSDFVIESFAPGYLAALGLGHAELSQVNHRIIVTSITPFGQTGPYADMSGSELIVSALGGVLSLCGDPDRAPVKEALHANAFHACASAVTATVMAHFHRERTGEGQHVDVSMQECAVTRNTTGLLAYQFDQRLLKRQGTSLQFGKAVVRYVWRLRDGHAIHALVSGKMGATANRALSAWMDELGCDNPMRDVDWDRYDRTTHDPAARQAWEKAIATFFAARTKQEIATEGLRRGINAAVVSQPLESLAHPHLLARQHIGHARMDGSTVVVPNGFVRTGHDDDASVRIPSLPGQDQASVNREFGLS